MKNKAVEKIKEIATDVYKEIAKLKSPSLIIPLRSLSNVNYDDKEGYFKIIGKTKEREKTNEASGKC